MLMLLFSALTFHVERYVHILPILILLTCLSRISEVEGVNAQENCDFIVSLSSYNVEEWINKKVVIEN
jgi:hypothetical protein